MPDYFTHMIAAEKIYERLDAETKSRITSRPLYLLGAQGGDVFFAYSIKLSQKNLGRELHAKSAEEVFSALRFANPSYLAGFATHYALDCTVHPVVYAFIEGRHTPFIHQTFEKDIGLYVSKFYGIRRAILPRESVMACTGPIYDSIKNILPQVTVTGVERCLKRHFSYTRYLYRTKKQTYSCKFDFPVFAGIVEEGVDLGLKAVKCALAGDLDPEVFGRKFLQR